MVAQDATTSSCVFRLAFGIGIATPWLLSSLSEELSQASSHSASRSRGRENEDVELTRWVEGRVEVEEEEWGKREGLRAMPGLAE